jgi:hypothetical protein
MASDMMGDQPSRSKTVNLCLVAQGEEEFNDAFAYG